MEGLIKCVSWIHVLVDDNPVAKLLAHKDYTHEQRLQKSAITCQRTWRRCIARRKLKILKSAAKEETVEKLENKVEDLERQLQMEKKLRNELEVSTEHERGLLLEALHGMQLEIEEANNVLDRDIEKIGLLNAEIESLKEMVMLEQLSSTAALQTYVELEDMIAELVLQEKDLASRAVQVHIELQENNCNLVNKIQDAEERVQEFQDYVQSLKERLLRLEAEKYHLRCGSFEVQKTSDFHHIIQKISTSVEAQEDKGLLCYWLSNSAMLLLLLQCTLKATEATCNESPSQRRSFSFIGKLFSGFHLAAENSDSSHSVFGRSGEICQTDDEYPASLFKEQLTDFIEKVYAMIRDNIKAEIQPLLQQCVQAPKSSLGSLMKVAPTHWQKIVKILHNNLTTMRINYVPPFLVRKMFGQIFSFINTQLFNGLFSQHEACTSVNSEFLKEGLSELENWCDDATQVYASGVMEELKRLRQAVAFLELNIQGLSKVSNTDKVYHRSSSRESSAKKTLTRVDTKARQLFLQDDDTSIPFSVDDISHSRT